jgi:hypothetical protein
LWSNKSSCQFNTPSHIVAYTRDIIVVHNKGRFSMWRWLLRPWKGFRITVLSTVRTGPTAFCFRYSLRLMWVPWGLIYTTVGCLYVTATNITRYLDWKLDLFGTVTVALNYSVYTLQLTVTLAESFHCVFTASLAYLTELWTLLLHCRLSTGILTQLNSATSYIAGEHGCSLLLCHMVFTVPLLRAHPLPSNCCVILVTRHTLLSPSNGCKQKLSLLTVDPQRARHTIIT